MSGDLVSWPDAPQPITNPSPGRYQIEVPIAAPHRFYRLAVTAF